MPRAGMIQTVLGAVDPDELGPTLTHEHLLVDVGCYLEEPDEASERHYVNAPIAIDNLGASASRWFRIRDQLRLYDEDEAIADAAAFRHRGGGTIVDVTSIGIGRDPLALARISRATGLHVVMGAGYYIPLSHPADLHLRTEDSLYEEMVREVTTGVGDSGIRAGILGELGCTYPLTDTSQRVLSAAGAASNATGAPISIHPGPDPRSPSRDHRCAGRRRCGSPEGCHRPPWLSPSRALGAARDRRGGLLCAVRPFRKLRGHVPEVFRLSGLCG